MEVHSFFSEVLVELLGFSQGSQEKKALALKKALFQINVCISN